ncbi:MAG: hypothetical protein IPH76_07515 [Xanthomonadales bacterium]|nr:hypothetical protein [Xanthomonadales bacterium]
MQTAWAPRSAFFNDCFVVRRGARPEADLIVVNHHLLFADLAIRHEGFGEILPGASLFIVDEAHQLPDLAGQFFGDSLGTRQLADLAQDALRESGDVPGARASMVRVAPAVEDQIKKLRLAVHGEAARGAWPPLRDKTAVQEAIALVAAALDELTAALDLLAEASEGLAACAERAGALAQQLSLWRGLAGRAGTCSGH